ncbi:MAG: serine/threonine-protein kinase [Myxococcales bacterium]|nr:serine/threonine-protein kinase [Myxococcales bacterium]
MAETNDSGAVWVPGAAIGPYGLIREIARGGMGEIWLALHRGPASFERLVVIKRVIGSAEDDPQFVSLFLDEARIVSQLHHPNVVQVFELGQAGNSYYLVMEYLPGQSLGRVVRRHLERRGPLAPDFAAKIIAEAAAGLGYAHARKGLDGVALRIVHRDVSPQNLLITYDGSVKVLDFGIAVASGRLSRTQAGIVRGRLAYMSPEQARSEEVDSSTDVYALGIILFELLAGGRRYGEADDLEIIKRLTTGVGLPRLADVGRFDVRLTQIVDRALAFDRRDRFTNGQQLREALEQWVTTRGQVETVRDTMVRLFEDEISKTSELDRATNVTPSGAMGKSLPLRPVAPARPSTRGIVVMVIAVALMLVATAGLTYGLTTRGEARATTTPPPPPAPVAASPTPPVPAALVVPAEAAPIAPGTAEAPADAGSGAPAVTNTAQRENLPSRAARGTLTLDSDPWTKVYLGKRALGETPLVSLPLPAGKHRLRLVNAAEMIDAEVEVVVPAGGSTVKRLSF